MAILLFWIILVLFTIIILLFIEVSDKLKKRKMDSGKRRLEKCIANKQKIKKRT